MKNKFYQMLKRRKTGVFLLCGILFAAVCGGCGKKEAVPGQGSVRFAEVSVEIDDNGDEFVFAWDYHKKFDIEIVDTLLWSGYGAVYDGNHYYFQERSSEIASLFPAKEEQMQLLSCRLGKDYRSAETLLELEGNWKDMGESFIQEGLLYTSWQSGKDVRKHIVVNLESGTQTEFSVPEERTVTAVDSSGYYYLDSGKVYFSKYKGGNEKLFFETDGQVCALYRDGENFCALVEREEGISVAILNGKGKLQEEYGGLEQIEGLRKGAHPVFIKAKNGILYYILTAKKEGTSYNTWLIRADLESGEKTSCGGWYVKQED